ncbi:site-specific integrase [Phenylobacterium sp.]|uniref:tyrosine-type recombinase/integrase n=1 Tax=Phenylobacterium sp. TaxID=1871053 RepID=UPI0025F8B415|nr:site-specific integrase [Phenylobacterium sp.]MCA3721351.1 integrase arm-type DNA-binding domain-containing protein [Phenylobacterium sp.]
MPRKVENQLTALQVKNLEAGSYIDGGGLRLLVKPTGARSWVFRFTLRGKTRDLGLGDAGPDGVKLSEARDLAAALRLKVKAGVDPLEEREREAAEALARAQADKIAAVTFKAAAEAHIEANGESWRNPKHRKQWGSTLKTYVYPHMGDIPVSEVTTTHVLAALEPIWKNRPETASRVRGRIEVVLNAAKAKGQRSGENPATWRGHLKMILPARSKLTRGHHAAMPYAKVPAFMARLRAARSVGARALEFAILTASRTGEVLGMTWREVDLKDNVWTVPAARMKAGKLHRVPLSPRAVAILAEMRKAGAEPDAPVFPGPKGGHLSNMALAMVLRRLGHEETVHGFRSAFRDWGSEQTGYSNEALEMALAHTIANAVERAYRRGDLLERRVRLMADWAAYCEGEAVAAGDNVTPLRQSA